MGEARWLQEGDCRPCGGARLLEADGATRRPFNLADLVRYERLDNRGRANPAYLCAERGVLAHAAAAGGDVVSNLAIARTGSETLALFLRALGQPSHHGHDCTLVDVARAGGARRVVVSLRDPLARLVSGFQRRMEGNNERKVWNRVMAKCFDAAAGGLTRFVEALRDADDPLHTDALLAVYGPTRQSYMVPVVEYYLQGMVATDRAGTRYVTEDDGLDVEVAFVCTPTLDSDLEALERRWRLGAADGSSKSGREKGEKHTHSSSMHSGSHDRLLRSELQEFVERVYAADKALYAAHCNASGGGATGSAGRASGRRAQASGLGGSRER